MNERWQDEPGIAPRVIQLEMWIDAWVKAELGIEPPKYCSRRYISKKELQQRVKEGIYK